MPLPDPPPYDSTGLEKHTISTFTFLSGTTLHDVHIAYRQYNRSSTLGTVLIPTCFSGHINTTLSFNHAPLSALKDYHVVVVAMLGNGESSSPSNKPFFPAAGELHYEDLVRAQHDMLTNGLGVKHLEAVIGFSMGGQQAYHWAIMYPDFVKRIVAICTSARTSGHNYAFLEGPVAAMTSSIDYVAWKQIQAKAAQGEEIGGNLKEVRPKKGLAAWSRAYAAWLTSAQWFRDREWEKIGAEDLEDWLTSNEKRYNGWNADDLLVKARMWQLADIGMTKNGEVTSLGGKATDNAALEEALSTITAKVLLMPCRTDQYFTPEESEIEMRSLKHGTLNVIESSWGHIAGGGANPGDASFMDARIAEHMQR